MDNRGCWCCGAQGIEHDPYIEVVAMNADAARAFAMPDAFKVVPVGQADAGRYRFGARTYRLFQTAAAYRRFLETEKEGDRDPDTL